MVYIMFEDGINGNWWVYDEDVFNSIKGIEYVVVDPEDIPYKDGFVTLAKLIDGELVWDFEEIIEPINPEKEILKLKKELEDKNKTISQFQNELSVLSDTVDFLIIKGDEAND